MSERSELRSRREERMENGVKNLKGARQFPKTFSNNGNVAAYFPVFFMGVRGGILISITLTSPRVARGLSKSSFFPTTKI